MARTRLDLAGKEVDTVQRQIAERNTLNRALAESGRLLQDAARQASDEAGMVGLSPLARALRENENRTRDLREQTALGGAISTTGLNSAFEAAIKKLISEFPSVRMTSGFRSQEEQDRLYANRANNPYPVARHSLHSQGIAADLSIPGNIRSDVVARAAQLGMVFPLKNDPVHAVFKGGQGAMGMPGMSADAIGGQRARNIIDEATSVDLRRQSDELDRQNALWKIRASMVGQSDDAINRAVRYQELLAEATKKGVSAATIGDDAWRRYAAGLGLLADKSAQVDKAQEALRKTVESMDLLRDVSKGALSSFTGDLIAGRSAAEALQHSLQGVLSKLLDMAENQLIASLFGKSGGLGGGLLGSLLGLGSGVGAPLSLLPSANGNVFGPDGLQAFANGGIVTRPTLFPFANGTGLMGEAGPEAIMPLQRGPDGRLGVSGAGGGGGGGTTVIVNNNADGTKATAKTDSEGNTTISIDTMVEAIEGRMASRVSRGRGPFAPILRTPKIG
jgi:hypothetical protein